MPEIANGLDVAPPLALAGSFYAALACYAAAFVACLVRSRIGHQ